MMAKRGVPAMTDRQALMAARQLIATPEQWICHGNNDKPSVRPRCNEAGVVEFCASAELIERLTYVSLPDQNGSRLPFADLAVEAATAIDTLTREMAEWRERARQREGEADAYSKRAWAAETTITELRARLEARPTTASGEARLAVARAIGATIDETNHMVRADIVIAALNAALPQSPASPEPEKGK